MLRDFLFVTIIILMAPFRSYGEDFRSLEAAFTQFELSPPFVGNSEAVAQSARDAVLGAQQRYESSSLRSLCQAQAIKTLEADRVQEAIWLLYECGATSEGQYLSRLLSQYLNRYPLVKGAAIGHGANGAAWGTIGKIKVVAKDPNQTSPNIPIVAQLFQRYGTAASVLANWLGLATIPHFQLKMVDGKKWSVQMAVLNAKTSGIDFQKNHIEYLAYGTDIFVLDFIAQNPDRHGGNSLVTSDGRIVGIDNEYWIMAPFRAASSARIRIFDVNPALYDRIQSASRSDIDRIFSGILSRYERAIMWSRIIKLKKIIRSSSAQQQSVSNQAQVTTERTDSASGSAEVQSVHSCKKLFE